MLETCDPVVDDGDAMLGHARSVDLVARILRPLAPVRIRLALALLLLLLLKLGSPDLQELFQAIQTLLD
jgi:hypothetical protein